MKHQNSVWVNNRTKATTQLSLFFKFIISEPFLEYQNSAEKIEISEIEKNILKMRIRNKSMLNPKLLPFMMLSLCAGWVIGYLMHFTTGMR